MNNIAFTICAKNYVGLAQVLESSVKKYCPEIAFYIIIADEFQEKVELNENIFIAREFVDIPLSLWNEMSFKYDLTEFCTAIKPFCFEALLQKFNPDSCLYFDPDILIFSNLESIFNALIDNSIIITPHITTLESAYTGILEEKKILFSGVFNLGFIGIKKDTISSSFLNWWKTRLIDKCFKSQNESYFTDQKWVDFLPSLFQFGVHISFDLGNNVAPWNFYERLIHFDNGEYWVTNRLTENKEITKLNFVHFSGFKYNLLSEGNIVQGNISDFTIQEDLLPVFNEYQNLLLKSSFMDYVKYTYSYNYFSNGEFINEEFRRMYRRFCEDKLFADNPFFSENYFYKMLHSNKLIKKSKLNTNQTYPNNQLLVKHVWKINLVFKLFYKILGPSRYFSFLKLCRRYAILENQVFLINPKYMKNMELRK